MGKVAYPCLARAVVGSAGASHKATHKATHKGTHKDIHRGARGGTHKSTHKGFYLIKGFEAGSEGLGSI